MARARGRDDLHSYFGSPIHNLRRQAVVVACYGGNAMTSPLALHSEGWFRSPPAWVEREGFDRRFDASDWVVRRIIRLSQIDGRLVDLARPMMENLRALGAVAGAGRLVDAA